jgi:hypothetical protein
MVGPGERRVRARLLQRAADGRADDLAVVLGDR